MIDTIEICLTKKCSMECSFCLLGCGPDIDLSLDDKVVKSVLDFAKRDARIQTIVYTGGEIFINYAYLVSLLKYSNGAGLNIVCLTNGFWCNDLNKTKERLMELKKYGLKKIVTSVDVWHQQQIPLNNIRNLIKCCDILNIEIQLTVSISHNKLTETYTYLQNLEESITKCNVVFMPVLPFKEGKNISEANLCFKQMMREFRCTIDSTMYIYANAEVYRCCLFPSAGCSELAVCNLNTTKIEDAYEYALADKYVAFMLMNGLNTWRQNKPEKYYASSCEYCLSILKNQDTRMELDEYIDKRKYCEKIKHIRNLFAN